MLNFMVSIATHYAILKNVGLTLEHLTLYQINC